MSDSVFSQRCCRCKQIKPVSQFNRNKNTNTGFQRQCRACYKEYYAANRDTYRRRYLSKREELIEYQKAWGSNNRTKRIKWKEAYYSMLGNVLYERLKNRYHAAFRRKKIKAEFGFRDLLGCNNVTLLSHFQSLYKEGMTDFNYGTEWEIDHYYPICSFNLHDPEHLKKCFHYTNVHPLWIHENQAKGTLMPEEYFTDDQEAV
jgi:hypothetical protein